MRGRTREKQSLEKLSEQNTQTLVLLDLRCREIEYMKLVVAEKHSPRQERLLGLTET